jgi:transketolase
MRRQFVTTLEALLETDSRVVLLLGDIGVFGFRKAHERFPGRVVNIGILEQASVSVAAGFSKEGFIPFFHSIAPFVVERAYEQLKVDFGYQRLGGNIVTVGASYDYPGLGCTHHCPGDVSLLLSVPGTNIFAPGHAEEFDAAVRSSYASGALNYFRLSERSNSTPSPNPNPGMAVIRRGTGPAVLAVGPILSAVIDACEGTDATIIYTNSVHPFAHDVLRDVVVASHGKLLCVEPWYEGSIAPLIAKSLNGVRACTSFCGVPRQFLTNYGTLADQDAACGLTARDIRSRFDSLDAL